MPSFPSHTIESAPAASKQILEGAQRSVGFVPNLYAAMAEAPALLQGYTTLAGIFDQTNLTETERQVILMTNNRLNGCLYCMAAHTTIAQGANVSADVIESLREGTPLADPKLEALRKFAEVINETRGWPTPTDLQAFYDAGYTQQTVLEVILGTSLKVLSNYTNHVAQTPLDSAFARNAWTQCQPAST